MHKEYEINDIGLAFIKEEKNNKISYINRFYYDSLKDILIKENVIEELENKKEKNKITIFNLKNKIKILKKLMVLIPAFLFLLSSITSSILFMILFTTTISIGVEILLDNKIKLYKEKMKDKNLENICINKLINDNQKEIKKLSKNKSTSKKNNTIIKIDDLEERKENLLNLKALIIYNKNREILTYYFKNGLLKELLNTLYDKEITEKICKMINDDNEYNNIKCKKNVI